MSKGIVSTVIDMTDGHDVVYREPDNLAATGWTIRYGKSGFLLCEGAGATNAIGLALFNEIISSRNSEPDRIDGGFVSCGKTEP